MNTLAEKTVTKSKDIRGYVMLQEDDGNFIVCGGNWFDNCGGANTNFSDTFASIDEAKKLFDELDPSFSFADYQKFSA